MTATVSPVTKSNSFVRGARITGASVGAILAYLFALWMALHFFAGKTFESALPEALQQTVNALSIGAIYALVALGYTLVYGIIELINFAHGDIFMIGAFLSVVFLGGIDGPDGRGHRPPAARPPPARRAPVRHAPRRTHQRHHRAAGLPAAPSRATTGPLITAIGVSFILQNIVLTIAGAGDRRSPQIFSTDWQIPFGGASISVLSIFIFVLSLGLMMALQAFVNRSRMGRAMRATAQDQNAASLMGVDLNQTIALTFLLGGMLAAAAGVAWGLRFGYVRFDLGFNSGLKAFTAAVLGGIGNISGAVLGGFIIGFIENFAVSLGYSRWSEFLVFMVLTFVLIFRPTGILGRQSGDRA